MPSPHNIDSILILLFVWVAFVYLRRHNDLVRRHSIWILVILAPVSLAAHANFLRYQQGLDDRDSWDLYHYYLGPKYFAELGHVGLYDAHAVADYQDDPIAYDPRGWVRVLSDYRLTRKSNVIRRQDEIMAAFSASRWSEFKEDVAAFRTGEVFWRRDARVLRDHGYNGSPLTTAVNGTLAKQHWMSVEMFLLLASWLDLVVVLGGAALIWRMLGLEWGLLFVALFGMNPTNDYITIGGSFLRYPYLVALAVGIAALLRGRNVTAGIIFAVSVHLRFSPILFPLALLAADLVRSDRWQLLVRRQRFYLAFAGTMVLLFAATAAVPTPGDQNVWSAFAENTSLHGQIFSFNTLGLRYPFSYFSGTPDDWRAAIKYTFEQKAHWFYLTAAAYLALTIVYLRRVRRDEEAMFVAFVWLFVGAQATVYDYAILSLIPLIFWKDERQWQSLGLAWIAMAAVTYFASDPSNYVLGYCVMSLVLGAYLAAVLVSRSFFGHAEEIENAREV